MTVHLVTFSDKSMRRAQELCLDSAMGHGCQSAEAYHAESWLQQERLAIRGLGYWNWKPDVILNAMRRLNNGDILIYSDVGVEFINSVNYIIERMDQDIFLFGNSWEHAHWCKRDIVDEVWPTTTHPLLADVERAVSWGSFGKQVQASVIFFRVNDTTRAFVKEWLDWCLFEGGRLIDDSPSRTPNHPEFQENRHDQAILTTMAYRDGYKLHWWPATYNMGAPGGGFVYPKDGYADEGIPPLFFHHRKRNHEWAVAV